MRAAVDRESGRVVYAVLEDSFWHRIVDNKVKGTSRYVCPECGSSVFGKGGKPGGTQRPHFVHAQSEGLGCGYGAPMSDEHWDLQNFVAVAIHRHPGWEAGVEVVGKGWRADVHATKTGGMTIDRDGVFARTGNGREVVFEIQHSDQTAQATRRRTNKYREAGCEVVWLFDRPPPQIGWTDPVVAVTRESGSYRVADGIWSPPGRPDNTPNLAWFVTEVLDGQYTYQEVPRGWKPRPEPRPSDPEMAWVHRNDQADLAKTRSTAKVIADRLDAMNAAIANIRATGRPAIARSTGAPTAAYAAIIEGPGGKIAIHPRPNLTKGTTVAALSTMRTVIARNATERQNLKNAGITAPIMVLDDFDVEAVFPPPGPGPEPADTGPHSMTPRHLRPPEDLAIAVRTPDTPHTPAPDPSPAATTPVPTQTVPAPPRLLQRLLAKFRPKTK